METLIYFFAIVGFLAMLVALSYGLYAVFEFVSSIDSVKANVSSLNAEESRQWDVIHKLEDRIDDVVATRSAAAHKTKK